MFESDALATMHKCIGKMCLDGRGNMVPQRNSTSTQSMQQLAEQLGLRGGTHFAASFRAGVFCRPVLFFDATWRTVRETGRILLASMMDGNNQILPFAIAIAPSESDWSWTSFFQLAKDAFAVVDPTWEPKVIISDRNQSIKNAKDSVWPDAQHSLCLRHIVSNLRDHCSPKHVRDNFV